MSKTYEMFWDCGFCGTEKLLGKTHRHCPACGAVQDPSKRYFPPEEEKVAVEDHSFVGVDQKCANCDTPNSAIADYCTNCGVPLDEAKAIDKLGEVDEGRQAGKRGVPDQPPEEDEGGSGAAAAAGGLASTGCLIGCGGLVLLFIILCALNTCMTGDTTVVVSNHTWERSIAIEKLKTVNDSDWCDDLPSGAKVRNRTEKEKSTKKVKDGEDCKKVNVDNGDGTFKKKKKCTPRFKKVPVNEDWCSFSVDRWDLHATPRQSGRLEDSPRWPTAKTDGCKKLGCTREGKRTERYTVEFVVEGGGRDSCDLPKARWESMPMGSRWTAGQTLLTSDLVCSELTPAD